MAAMGIEIVVIGECSELFARGLDFSAYERKIVLSHNIASSVDDAIDWICRDEEEEGDGDRIIHISGVGAMNVAEIVLECFPKIDVVVVEIPFIFLSP